MLPEGEDLNEWIAVNSKSWETEIHQSVGGEWSGRMQISAFHPSKEANRKCPKTKFLSQLYSV